MEFTMRTIVIMILLLVGLLVFATMVLNWGGDINSWFRIAVDPLSETITG